MFVCVLSCVRLLATLWTVDCQAPLSMEFSWQEYWSGLPLHTPGNLPNPGIKPMSLVSPALAGRFFIIEPTGKPKREGRSKQTFIGYLLCTLSTFYLLDSSHESLQVDTLDL